MKLLNPKGGFPKCSYCESKARWTASTLGNRPNSCDECRASLQKWEQERGAADSRPLTEADLETWSG